MKLRAIHNSISSPSVFAPKRKTISRAPIPPMVRGSAVAIVATKKRKRQSKRSVV